MRPYPKVQTWAATPWVGVTAVDGVAKREPGLQLCISENRPQRDSQNWISLLVIYFLSKCKEDPL